LIIGFRVEEHATKKLLITSEKQECVCGEGKSLAIKHHHSHS